jgi:hypothetical protein
MAGITRAIGARCSRSETRWAIPPWRGLDLEELAVPDTPPVNLELSIEVQDVAEWHDRLVGADVPISRGL